VIWRVGVAPAGQQTEGRGGGQPGVGIEVEHLGKKERGCQP
jgi:hypothetical protein